MQTAEPTTLYVPGLAEPAAPSVGVLGFAWVAVVVPVAVVVVWHLVRRGRLARLSPEERAFRSLARRLKLRAGQVESVRTYASRQGGCLPIEVLMDDVKYAQAVGEAA